MLLRIDKPRVLRRCVSLISSKPCTPSTLKPLLLLFLHSGRVSPCAGERERGIARSISRLRSAPRVRPPLGASLALPEAVVDPCTGVPRP